MHTQNLLCTHTICEDRCIYIHVRRSLYIQHTQFAKIAVYTKFAKIVVYTYTNFCEDGMYRIESRGRGLGSRPIFKKFNEPYAPS